MKTSFLAASLAPLLFSVVAAAQTYTCTVEGVRREPGFPPHVPGVDIRSYYYGKGPTQNDAYMEALGKCQSNFNDMCTPLSCRVQKDKN